MVGDEISQRDFDAEDFSFIRDELDADIMLLLLRCLGALGSAMGGDGWRNDWMVEQRFAPTIDAGGFEFPSAIAFVPKPSPEPPSPP